MFSDYNEGQSYIFIPLDAPIGVYDLKVYDFGAESYQILEDIFTITLAPEPTINSISQEFADQGQILSVSINTTNVLLGDYSGTASQFRFSQDGQNQFYGSTDNTIQNELVGSIIIPFNQNPGLYDLEVYNFNTDNWVIAEDIFTVNEPPLPSVDYISQNSSVQGEYLNVDINITNIPISYNTQFRFVNDNHIFYGNSIDYYDDFFFNAYVSIPDNQEPGLFDLEVFNSSTNSWVIANDIFTVESPLVIQGTGGCIDSTAFNFDSNAIFDDGSCCYDPPSVDLIGGINIYISQNSYQEYIYTDNFQFDQFGSATVNNGNYWGNDNGNWDDIIEQYGGDLQYNQLEFEEYVWRLFYI